MDHLDGTFEGHREHGGYVIYWMHNDHFQVRSGWEGQGMGITTNLLQASRAIHEEAEALLYQLHEFDFYLDVYGVFPFLRSLSHNARQNISCLTMYVHDNSRTWIGALAPSASARFSFTCAYIAQNVRLREFAFYTEQWPSEDFRNLSWIQDMAQIKGIQKLTYYEAKHLWRKAVGTLGIIDQDPFTAGVSVRNQKLLSNLYSEMLASSCTRT